MATRVTADPAPDAARRDTERYRFTHGTGLFALWFGVMAGPLAVLTNEQVGYMLVPWACNSDHRWAMHLVPIAMLAVTAIAALLAMRDWRRTGRDWPDEAPGAIARARFMAVSGVALCALSALMIVGMGAANLFRSPGHVT